MSFKSTSDTIKRAIFSGKSTDKMQSPASAPTNNATAAILAGAQALEPRIVFDAAAPATIAEVTSEPAVQTETNEPIGSEDASDFLAALGDADGPASSEKSEIIFIVSNVENASDLLAEISSTAEVVIIDESENGIEKIASVLEGREDIDAIHIISHGSEGALDLGSSELNSDTITGEYADELALIGQSLSQDADMLFYGCNFGDGEAGETAVEALSAATGADIAASDDLTGSEELGGNWDLETTTGSIETEVLSAVEWSHLLADVSDGTVSIEEQSEAGTILLSNDGDPLVVSEVGTPMGTSEIVDRLWQYNEPSGDTGTTTIRFDTSSITGITSNQQSDFGLVISDGTDLANPASNAIVISASGYDSTTGEVIFRLVNFDDGQYFTLATSREIDNFSVASNTLTTNEDTPVDLNITLSTAVTSGGQLQDTIGTDTGYRPEGSTDYTEYAIPAGAETITITGYSTEPGNTGANDSYNDDYQTLSVTIDLDTGLASGSVNYIVDRLNQNSDQYSFVDAPLGQSILTGGATITGNADDGIDPVFEIVDGKLRITENHGLQSAYHLEFLASENESTNFLGTESAVLEPGNAAVNTTATITIPPEVIASGGIIVINESSAAAGSNFNQESKGFGRIVVNLDTMTASGIIAAEAGETQNNTVTYGFEDLDVSSSNVGGVLSSSATVTGDVTGSSNVSNSPNIYIDANGLNIVRTDGFAQTYTSMYTVEFYERVDAGSIAAFVSTEVDDSYFNASTKNPPDNSLDFNVPASAEIGVFRVSMVSVGGGNTNENVGTGYAVIDLENGTTSGSFTNIRTSSPDLISWSDVPFGVTIFDHPNTVSNHSTADQFVDDFGATAKFDFVTQSDSTSVLSFVSSSSASNGNFADYYTNGSVQWLGSEPFQVTGIPATGELSSGSPTPHGNYDIDVNDVESLQYVPGEHRADSNQPETITLELFGETEVIEIIVVPVADTPNLATKNAIGQEDETLDISSSVLVSLVDQDGSESFNQILISGIKQGYTLSDGVNSYTAPADGSSVDIVSWNLDGLTITPPENVAETLTLGVLVETIEADNGDTASTSDTFDVTFQAVADAPLIGYEFDGTDIVYATDDNNDFPRTQITVDLTIKHDNIANLSSLFSYAVNGSSNEFLVFQTPNSLVLIVNGKSHTISLVADLDPHRFTVTFDQTETVDNLLVYMDGIEIGSFDFNTSPLSSGGALVFGQEQDSVLGTFDANQIMNGTIFDANIYSRVLTAEEIASQSAGNGDFVSLDFSQMDNAIVTGANGSSISIFERGTVQGSDTIVPLDVTSEDANTIPLNLNTIIVDTDGSESLTVIVSDIPVGAVISDGTGSSFTATLGNTSVDVSLWNMADIVVTPVEHSDSDIVLNITATVTEAINGDTATSTSNVTFIVKAVADAPTLSTSNETKLQDTEIDLSDNLAGTLVDTDGSESLTYTISNVPAGASFTVSDGVGGLETLQISGGAVTLTQQQLSTLKFTPPLGFFGTITLDVVATANEGATGDQVDVETADSTTQQIVLTITPLNLPPVVEAGDELPDISAQDAGSFSVNASTAFTDPNGNNTLSYTATALPAFLSIDNITGIISVNTVGGKIPSDASQGNSGGGAAGEYVITVQATDEFGESTTDTFTLTISNQGPDAVNDGVSVDEDGTLNGDVSANDVDPDGDANSFSQTSAPSNGTLNFNANGTFTYIPNADFNGSDSFTYAMNDGQGGTDTATVTITVNAVNDAPVANAIVDQLNSDGDAITPITPTFTDVDGPGVTFSATGLPTGLNINGFTGEISGTIDGSASVSSPYSVQITVDDGAGGTDVISFEWTVTNPAPDAVVDTFTVNEDGTLIDSVLTNDNDPDGDALSVNTTPVSGPSSGALVLNSNGSFTYTPNADFNGSDSFTYEVSDGQGGIDTATVNITVASVNDAPVVNAPLADVTMQDGNTVSLETEGAFSDIDGDVLTYTATGLPNGLSINTGTGEISGTIANNQSLVSPFNIEITATDGDNESVSDQFVMTVTNPAPIVDSPIADQSSSDSDAVNLPVSSAFTDPDGDVLQFSATGLPTGLSIDPLSGAISGTIDNSASQGGVAGDGVYTIVVTATDNQGGTVTDTFTWNVDNTPPVLGVPLPDVAFEDGDGVSINTSTAFSNNDGDVLTFDAAGLPVGLTIDTATGIISGTLDSSASVTGTYSITITADDGQGGEAFDTFVMTVTNPAPAIISPIADQANADAEAVSLDVSNAFADQDQDILTFDATGLPDGLMINTSSGLIQGTVDNSASQNGPFTVVVTADDGEGGVTTDTFTWTITNQAPVTDSAISDHVSNDADTISVNVSSNFSDPDSDVLTFSATGLPNGLSIDPGTGEISGTIDADASSGGVSNDGVYSVTIEVDDGEGGTKIDTFTWTINDPAPTIVAPILNQTSLDNEVISLNVSAAFSDPDGDTLVYSAIGLPTGLAIDANTGEISGQVDNSASVAGSFAVTITASDGTNNVTDTFQWTVTNVDPVVQITTPNQTNLDGAEISLDVSGAFSDPDTDVLTYSVSGLPAGLSINPGSGVITGTIDANASQFGPFTVTVTADDGEGGQVTDTFQWAVTNPGPVAGDDLIVTTEDNSVSSNVLTNDVDPDGDALVVEATLIAEATNGTVVIAADGNYTYTPDANFNGADSFVYQVNDGQGGIDTATVNITVTSINDAPTVDATIVNQLNADAQAVSLDISGAFSDIDGDALSYNASGLPAGLSIDANTGVITGIIDSSASVNSPYTVSIVASDGNGGSVATTFFWQVSNPAPVAADDVFAISEDITLTGNLLGNDVDPDGDNLVVDPTPIVAPANGTVTLLQDGSFSYVPNENYTGTDSFVYRILDNEGGVSTATVNISIASVNDAPEVNFEVPDQNVFDGNSVAIDVSGNFIDPDNNTLTYSADTLPAGLVLDPNTGEITGQIAADASQGGLGSNGVYVTTISAADPFGEIVTDTFVWTIQNPAPIVDTEISDMTANDSDAFNFAADSFFQDSDNDSLTYSATGLPTGLAIDSATGTISGVLASDASIGGPDEIGIYEITIQVDDGEGGSVQDTFNLQVFNKSPNISDPIINQVSEDATGISMNVTGNFANPDGDPLMYSALGLPPGLSIDANSGIISGVLDNSASQVPVAYTVTVVVDDGQGGVAGQSFTWTITNPAPVVANEIADMSSVDTESISLDVTTYILDPDQDDLTFSATGLPVGISLDPDTGLLSGLLDNSASLNSPYTVAITADDGEGGQVTETFTWTIANLGPTAADLTISAVEDGTVNGTVSPIIDDPDNDDLTVSLLDSPTNGNVSVNSDGTFVYTPDANYNGVDSFVYQVDDGEGGIATGVVSLNIAPANDAPVVVANLPDQSFVDGEAGVSISTAAAFTDVDMDPLTFSAANLPTGLSINPVSGEITGTIAGSASVVGNYNAIVTVDDGNGRSVSTSFKIEVENVAPVANDDTAVLLEDGITTISILSNDSDADGDTFAVTSASALNGAVIVNANGTITYEPNKDYNGQDTITYTIDDGEGGTDTASVDVEVRSVNDAPTVVAVIPDQVSQDSNSISFNVAASFTDLDADPLAYSATGLPAGISIGETSGEIAGTIAPNASQGGPASDGSYTVTITADDGLGGTVQTQFNWSISNIAPSVVVSLPNVALVDGQSGVSIPTSNAFDDSDLDTLTFSASNLPNGLSIDPVSGEISGTVDGSASLSGTYIVTITANDGEGGQASTPFEIAVANVVPLAADDIATTSEDQSITISILANDIDTDGDSQTVVSATAQNGQVVINPNGTITYIPDLNYNGVETINYIINDGEGGTAAASVTITVLAVNDAPVLTGTSPDYSFNEGDEVTIDLAQYFTDVDSGSTVTFSAMGLPSGISVDPVTGQLTGSLPLNSSGNGPYTVTIFADDGNGGRISMSFVIDVVQTIVANPENLIPESTIIVGDENGSNTVETSSDENSGLENLAPVESELYVSRTANNVERLGETADLQVAHPVLKVVNDAGRLSNSASLVGEEFNISLEYSGDTNFAGYSLEADIVSGLQFDDINKKGQIYIESIVHKDIIYLNVNSSIDNSLGLEVAKYRFTLPNGEEIPSWISFSESGMAVIHRPVNLEMLQLRVVAEFGNGEIFENIIEIQTLSGELEFINNPNSANITQGQLFSTMLNDELAEVEKTELFDALEF
ncbi:MAG: putative Ig domain-containing protein [Pseudomonadota bacterium]